MQNHKTIHIVVFTGGLYPEPEKTNIFWKTHPQPDYVIAADSGLVACLQYGFNPCVILGDFDSLEHKELLDLFNDDVKVPFPQDKDFTDTELAVHKAYEIAEKQKAIPFITLVGGDGGRIDHLLNIFDCFSGDKHPDVWLCAQQAIYFLKDGNKFEINGLKKEDYVSIARPTSSYDKGCCVTEGLEWGGELFRKKGMPSVSNRISKEFLKSRLPLKIKAENGDFLLILPLNAVVY